MISKSAPRISTRPHSRSRHGLTRRLREAFATTGTRTLEISVGRPSGALTMVVDPDKLGPITVAIVSPRRSG
jgi:hypothetical protein